MNTVIWLVAGAMLGWIAFAALRYNANRGMIVSMVIGAMGGMLGGKLVAPIFLGGPAGVEGFSIGALVFAAAVAATCLVIANLINNRWGV